MKVLFYTFQVRVVLLMYVLITCVILTNNMIMYMTVINEVQNFKYVQFLISQ